MFEQPAGEQIPLDAMATEITRRLHPRASLLFALFDVLELAYRHRFGRLNAFPGFFYKARETQGQFADSFRLAAFDRFRRNKLAADTERRGSCQDIISSGLLSHP